MKKYMFFLLALSFLILPIPCFSESLDSSKSSIVMDIDSGRILYSNNKDDTRLIASITKIMTSVIAIENAKLNTTYTAKEEILKMYGTSIYLEYNEKMSLKNLLYGLMLRSGNDAAVVIANNVCKDEKEFVKLMNQKAQQLGMKNTSFSNSHGLDEETKNYSSAYDMALLSSYAYKNHSIYRKITKTKRYEVSTKNKSYLWYNRNKLLGDYEYCTGGKNGYTPSAGRTLVTTSEKDNLRLTVVTLDDPNEYITHKNLYEYIYSQYHNYKIIDKNNFSIDQTFFQDPLYLKKSFSYPLSEEELDEVKTVMKITKTKGYKKNEKVGKIEIYLKNKKIGTVHIYAKKNS
ncbi:MAG: D-alanyl-D-alanine carboxypeptidase [Bacilli bacterium]|nr:D-alanyl-D-alanine carboxypeptidase [Bacilli bacterium]